jgi:MFS family permease
MLELDLKDNEAPTSTASDPEPQTKPSTPTKPQSPVKEAAFIAVVCAAQLMTQAGLSLSIAPLHYIGKSFNTTPRDLTWASAAYSLTVGTFILVSGRLGDTYGHRLLFIIGFTWFGIWSLLGGFAVWSNQIFFDCCRAFQGIGPALLLPNAVAIFGRTYAPGLKKDMVFCLFGATAPGGFTLGATFCSLLAQRVWWPWGYWIMGIACFCFAVLGFVLIPRDEIKESEKTEGSTFARLDGLGAITGVSGLVLINFAWNQAAVVGWRVPYTYALLIVGILFLVVFMMVERRAAFPLLPSSVFKGEVGWVLGCMAAGWSSFGILVFYYYNFLETIEHNSGLLITAKWAGASASGATAAVITGLLLSRVPPSFIMLAAMLAFTIGLSLLATIPPGQTYWANAFLIMLITPWGM